MKLTGKLKEQVEQTNTMEDAKEIIKEAGMELTDDEMDQVAGGFIPRPTGILQTVRLPKVSKYS